MKLSRRTFTKALSLAIVSPALVRGALAQDAYPSKPVTVVVPYNAGGPVDLLGRIVLDKVEQSLNQRFLIESKPGAGGAVGADFVSRAPNDGYTLLLGSASALVTVKVARGETLEFDPLTDLVPVVTFSRRPYVMLVRPDSGFKTVQDFIDAAKENPGKFTYGSAGTGGSDYFISEYFKHLAGIDMLHIPYNGGNAAVQAVEAGEVDMYLGGLTQYVQTVKTGRLAALGVSSLERISQAPELPPIAETLPGFQAYTGIDLFAPKGTPAEIVTLLGDELKKAMREPGVYEKVLESGELKDDSSEELSAWMANDYETLKHLAETLNLQLE